MFRKLPNNLLRLAEKYPRSAVVASLAATAMLMTGTIDTEFKWPNTSLSDEASCRTNVVYGPSEDGVTRKPVEFQAILNGVAAYDKTLSTTFKISPLNIESAASTLEDVPKLTVADSRTVPADLIKHGDYGTVGATIEFDQGPHKEAKIACSGIAYYGEL